VEVSLARTTPTDVLPSPDRGKGRTLIAGACQTRDAELNRRRVETVGHPNPAKQKTSRTLNMKPSHSTTIISLSTNTVARSAITLPDQATKDHVTRLLRHGSDDMPMVPGYFVTLSLARGCAQLLVSKHGNHLLTAGMAWADANSDSADMWAWLLDFRAATSCQRLCARDTSMRSQPPYPWLATLYGPAVTRLPMHEATALVVYQRFLIADLIHRMA